MFSKKQKPLVVELSESDKVWIAHMIKKYGKAGAYLKVCNRLDTLRIFGSERAAIINALRKEQ